MNTDPALLALLERYVVMQEAKVKSVQETQVMLADTLKQVLATLTKPSVYAEPEQLLRVKLRSPDDVDNDWPEPRIV